LAATCTPFDPTEIYHPALCRPGRIRSQQPTGKYAAYRAAAATLSALAPRIAPRLLPEAPGGGDPGERCLVGGGGVFRSMVLTGVGLWEGGGVVMLIVGWCREWWWCLWGRCWCVLVMVLALVMVVELELGPRGVQGVGGRCCI
jgi:hypothetical protein